MTRSLKLAVIAGEVSGDLLGGDLVAALRRQGKNEISLVGVGGEALQAEGLVSLFDYSELSIMGFSQVVAKLPKLMRLIRQTAAAIVAARPDMLVIIDSPDFTHRVARLVRKELPDLPVVNYVCPSVWAWKEERAPRMRSYVDHVLAVLPFEPSVMARLQGPPTTYVGHRLSSDPDVSAVRSAQLAKAAPPLGSGTRRTCLLLPGSRAGEISRLLPAFGEAVAELSNGEVPFDFRLPTVPRQSELVRRIIADWPVKPAVTVEASEKWKAFQAADVAIAASGTVLLELGLARVPVVSCYKLDWIAKLMTRKIKTWTAALPNLIADYPVIPEYLNEVVRPGSLARWAVRLSHDTVQRQAMLEGFDLVLSRMREERSPGDKAADVVIDVLKQKKPGLI
ncbi:lipid-A-disaccharide synthase [Rhizobium subbaraonis]|uniref:Lipid-A-disaccharide synthase n=1 Tax=Rhizobium subbaraonis TaxID=908946 RepID=A0A285UAA0_9HYPH|nr:lipid-A-disaccharide synthase [Rhizobium subbaraonis]SOC38729.1 lipid-A-disaccharide synthase [Rhizobium subbaraonis]